MGEKKTISPIYKVLLLFEDVQNNSSSVTEEQYVNYIDRLYVRYLGQGNEEVYQTLYGLYLLGASAKHDTVKRAVFHIIEILDKGGI